MHPSSWLCLAAMACGGQQEAEAPTPEAPRANHGDRATEARAAKAVEPVDDVVRWWPVVTQVTGAEGPKSTLRIDLRIPGQPLQSHDLGTYYGVCEPETTGPEVFAAGFDCWWLGAHDNVRIRVTDGALEVLRSRDENVAEGSFVRLGEPILLPRGVPVLLVP